MIGAAVARSLANSGHRAIGYDIDPAAADRLADLLDAAGSPADVARGSDVIHLAVLTAEQALAVLDGPDGILESARPGTTVLLLSTVAPAKLDAIAELGAASGVTILDCGVTRGEDPDRNTMTATVGGDPVDVERVRPVIEAWARTLVHCGPLGTGMAVKIGRNAVTFGMWRALEETTRMLLAAGVPEDRIIEALRASDPTGELLYGQRLHIGRFPAGTPERAAAVEHGRSILEKDMAAVLELAERGGVAVPMLEVVRREAGDSMDGYHA